MGNTYVVQECETLLSIAEAKGFRSIDPLLAVNPRLAQLCQNNFDVLQPGLEISLPYPQSFDQPAPSDAKTQFVLKTTKKDLVVTIQGPDRQLLKRGSFALAYDLSTGKKVSKYGKIADGVLRFKDWPAEVVEAELIVSLQYNYRVDEAWPNKQDQDSRQVHKEKIKLLVGGLDPLTGPETARNRAVQKILTNLGFYVGDIDGDLTSPSSQAALHKFKHVLKIKTHGSQLIDSETLNRLADEQQNRIARQDAPPTAMLKQRDEPLQLSKQPPEIKEEQVTDWSGYQEPTSGEQLTRRKFGEMRYFPKQAFVAPCDPGKTDNPNVIRMKSRRFIFLDSGRWLGPGRDFSVIWGRHVYRCQYKRTEGLERFSAGVGDPLCPESDRLDAIFFRAMSGRVEVLQTAVASWAFEYEFNWDKVVIVIPDTHLMGFVAGNNWKNGHFDLEPELDLLDFAFQLSHVEDLQGKTTVIQIGDSYDLWVACTPRYFTKNDDYLLELYRPEQQKWNCGATACPGHSSRNALCPNGRWRCGYVNCNGVHKSPGEKCPYENYQVWNCGRVKPRCPGIHRHPDDLCPDGFEEAGAQWKCTKTDPPCPRHSVKSERCPDYIDPVAQLCQWIREIQGVSSAWVRPLLQNKGIAPDIMEEFKKNSEDSTLGLEAGKSTSLWLNPAEKAFRILGQNCTFIYGNHDNYLITRRVTEAAGIPRRRRFWETDGLFIEHGHRLEGTLIFTSHPYANYDGSTTGYEATIDYYEDCKELMARKEQPGFLQKKKIKIADEFAQYCQQNQYWGEFAQIWIGRDTLHLWGLKAPHVFVIGHTHMPMLAYINIDFSKLFF